MRFNLRPRCHHEMNTSVLNSLPPIGFSIADAPTSSARRSIPTVRRRPSTAKMIAMLSWVVAISASFLTVGVIGVFAADLPPINLLSLEPDSAADQAMIDTSMAELQSMENSEEAAAEPEETSLPVEIPDQIETPPENLDLPELAEALTLEDVFAVPTAPKIEDALRPVDPVVKPRPTTPKRRALSTSRSGSSTSSSRIGSATGSRGGTGSGVGTGRGKFPAPPYPSFARSSGMQGTVRLGISVGPSGAVESVNVMSSTGYSSLDEYAASWVRRNWRWPGGAANRYTLPLTFRLR